MQPVNSVVSTTQERGCDGRSKSTKLGCWRANTPNSLCSLRGPEKLTLIAALILTNYALKSTDERLIGM